MTMNESSIGNSRGGKLHSRVFKTSKEAEDYADYNLFEREWSGIFQTKNDNFRIKLT